MLEKRRGTSASLYLAKERADRWDQFHAMPDAAGGEGVTGSLNHKG